MMRITARVWRVPLFFASVAWINTFVPSLTHNSLLNDLYHLADSGAGQHLFMWAAFPRACKRYMPHPSGQRTLSDAKSIKSLITC
ncbi:MAG: hypothetical protein ACPIOQ_76700, partial [Promethearchaeia archaeon]